MCNGTVTQEFHVLSARREIGAEAHFAVLL
jgi:hypothetical protein